MTYLQFLLIFIVPVILLLIFAKPWKRSEVEGRSIVISLILLCAIAFLYTTPWDNFLVFKGVWNYPEDRVLLTIGYVPFEEYLFFVLQTIMTGLLFFLFLRNFRFEMAGPSVGGAIFWFLISAGGLFCLFQDSTFYLGLILSWASPVLAFQWAFGGNAFEKSFAHYLKCVLVPTLYLWLCDSVAIHLNIWSISEKYTTGMKIGVLPLEEALFFLVTDLLVVQGLWLFTVHRYRVRKVWA